VTVTKNPGDLPVPVLIAPHDCEISDSLALATCKLAEAMRTLCNGSEVLDWGNLESARDELATEVAAHIFLCVGEHLLPRPSDATSVVVELNVRREIAGVHLKLLWGAAIIESVEYSAVERRDSLKQRSGDLFGSWIAA